MSQLCEWLWLQHDNVYDTMVVGPLRKTVEKVVKSVGGAAGRDAASALGTSNGTQCLCRTWL